MYGGAPTATPKQRRGRSHYPAKMTAAQFVAWRKRHGLTKQEAADALGLKLRVIYNFEDSTNKVSGTVALLCNAYDGGWRRPG